MPKLRGNRVSYVIHWSVATEVNGKKYFDVGSQIFSKFDETLISYLKALRANPNKLAEPVVERLVHMDLTPTEKRKIK